MIDQNVMQDPYAAYVEMALQGDIFWNSHYRCWCVMGYKLACEAFTQSEFSSDISDFLLATTFPREARCEAAPLVNFFKQWMFYLDPPQHTLLRRELSTVFSQKSIADYQPKIEKMIHAVCAAQRGSFDFLKDVAQVIASRVMAHILNLPDSDAPQLLRWTADLAGFLDAFVRTRDDARIATQAMNDMQSYFKSNWILNAMLVATGIETTLSFLSSALYTLLQYPEQLTLLRQKPELLDQALEELFRFEPPAHLTVRRAQCDLYFHGCDIKKEDIISIFVAAANRDPRQFKQPHQFDIQRQYSASLSFGYGIHYCLGRLLARLTARTCIAYILDHWPVIHLDDAVTWKMGTSLRHVASLRIAID